MPRPVDAKGTYLPALDGLRALAVGAVVAYHLGVERTPGGLLGVGVFFTLSGFLITSILRSTWERTGGLDLRHFWVRRARRLLPAVVVLLVVVAGVTVLTDRGNLGVRFAETLGALLYVSNWTTIHLGVSYFQRFDGPGPLDHLWSLSVEEQFYLLWPLVLWVLIVLWRRRWDRIALTTLGLAAVSFVLLWSTAHPGFDTTRAYEGTDTRAGGLLVGAALGMLWRPARLSSRLAPRARLIIDGTGLLALLVIALLVAFTDQYSLFTYRGGLVVLSVATTVLIAVSTHPASVLGRALGAAPLRWVGERSYGIYLWHLPVIVFMPASALAGNALRPWVIVGVILALATLSWALVEDPIRRRGLTGALRRHRSGREHRAWAGTAARGGTSRGRGPALVTNVVALVLVATAGLTAVDVSGAAARDVGGPQPSDLNNPPLPPAVGDAPVAGQSTAPSPTSGTAPTNVPQTSCRAVDHVGDSTSVGLMSKDYLPTAGDRLDAQYALVGVGKVTTDIQGARSIVERWNDQPNAEDVVTSEVGAGYAGCWVFALGTNEVANRAVGGGWSLGQRIDLLMRHVGNAPVLWTTVKTLATTGPYAASGYQDWTDALVQACSRYPNMRVYDWAAEVQDPWFISDGIHYTTPGYRQRAHRIAEALATAFPAKGASPESCLIRTPQTPRTPG